MNQAMLNTELYQTMYAEQERYKAELLCMPRKKLRMSAGPPHTAASHGWCCRRVCAGWQPVSAADASGSPAG